MANKDKKKLTLHQQNPLVTEWILEHFMSKEMRASIEEEANKELKATIAELQEELRLKEEAILRLQEETRLMKEARLRLQEETMLKKF